MSAYTVKSLKSFIGREGRGFNVSLYRDGVKVAFIMEMADGGAMRFDWLADGERERLESAAGTNGADCFVEDLVNDFAQEVRVRRILRKQILILTDGRVASIPAAVGVSPEQMDRVQAKWPDCVILNRLGIKDAVRIIAEHTP